MNHVAVCAYARERESVCDEVEITYREKQSCPQEKHVKHDVVAGCVVRKRDILSGGQNATILASRKHFVYRYLLTMCPLL